MGTRYVPISRSALLGELSRVAELVRSSGGVGRKYVHDGTLCFDLGPQRGRYLLHVHTSLGAHADVVYECDADAVRLAYLDRTANLPGPWVRRIYRTAPPGPHTERERAFLDRLTTALREQYRELLKLNAR
jgi:hypothetical protein